MNLILLTDSYKCSHWRQYPPGTESVYSYFESRGGNFPATVFFGLQYLCLKYLTGPVVTERDVNQAAYLLGKHFDNESLFNRQGWLHIVDKHGGNLPVRIRAVKEGSVIPVSNVLMTIENTDPECYWLTNYLETLLVQCWYGTTVATQSYYMRQMILNCLEKTGTPELVDFKLHDFGFRGVSCVEQASIGGAAHLINFKGTDTLAGILLAREFYDCDMAGFSIPAAEHSTITAWGESRELDAMRNMLQQYPSGLVAVVSDSFDVYRACQEYWGGVLKNEVLTRDGVLVIRPDSGDPCEVISKVLGILSGEFGYEWNAKGYKVLNPKIRLIQGDGIDYQTLGQILHSMQSNKWSADNIAFGSGGGLLQKLNRDTCKFAFKCSSVTVNGKRVDVFKDPVTDAGKRSKRGRLKLCRDDGGYFTVQENVFHNHADQLETVFENGRLMRSQTLDEIRALTAKGSP